MRQSAIRNPQSAIRRHPHAALILLAFILLALLYSLITPPFEAGDESRHYAVVKAMVDSGRLPVQEPGPLQTHASHEANQPPLYYALAAALTGWIETGGWDDVFWYNPHTTIGDPLRPDNKNITIHPPGAGWPWRGHVLAVHLIRFLSIAMAAVTVSAAYAIALSLFRGRRWPAAGAMAITAFNPMFIFISASVNNDNAVIMFITLALWLTVAINNEQLAINNEQTPWPPCSPAPRLFRFAALLGLLIGLGALSKLYALGLLPLAGLFFLWIAYKRRRQSDRAAQADSLSQPDPAHSSRFTFDVLRPTFDVLRRALTWTAITLFIALAVAGWFYLRNALLYDGDVLALQVMRDTAGQRDELPTLATIRAEFKGFRIAYWALFGGVNILADDWIYAVLDGFSLAAGVGVVGFIVAILVGNRGEGGQEAEERGERREERGQRSRGQGGGYVLRFTSHPSRVSLPVFVLLLAWYLIMVGGVIVWNLTQPAGQGRLLYPAIAAISALGMLGLGWWLPPAGQKGLVALVSVGLFAFALLSPFRYIAPAYAKPPRLDRAEIPPDLEPVNYLYDGRLRLIGYKLHTETVRPSEALPLTLYWEVVQPTGLDYSIFIHLLGWERRVVGQLDTYPGGGKWPTTLLAPGDVLADHYRVPVAPQAGSEQAPAQLLIAAGIYDLHEAGRPGKPATNARGEAVEPIIATAKLVPWQWPDPPQVEKPVNFSDKVTLLGRQIDPNQQAVTLTWQVEQPLGTDYTVFIQAWPAGADRYAAGFDGPPVQGHYPTGLWAPGEIIVDRHPLDLSVLSPGEYRLLAGLYDPFTEERLPAFGPNGPLPDYAVEVGTITVGKAGEQRGERAAEERGEKREERGERREEFED